MTETMWRRPLLRGNDPGHRQATWAELFFDLIFVVAVAQLATLLLEEVTWRGAMIYVFAYVPVWFSWIAATLYSCAAIRWLSAGCSPRPLCAT